MSVTCLPCADSSSVLPKSLLRRCDDPRRDPSKYPDLPSCPSALRGESPPSPSMLRVEAAPAEAVGGAPREPFDSDTARKNDFICTIGMRLPRDRSGDLAPDSGT